MRAAAVRAVLVLLAMVGGSLPHAWARDGAGGASPPGGKFANRAAVATPTPATGRPGAGERAPATLPTASARRMDTTGGVRSAARPGR